MPPFTIRFGNDYAASSGAVDGSIIAARMTDAGAAYVLGGVTLQTLAEPAMGSAASGGWTSGDDLRLRGRWRRANGSAPLILAITPPDGPGEYELVLGTAAASYQRNRWRVLDGPGGTARVDESSSSQPTFWPDDNSPTTLDQWIDQQGVVRAIGANALVGVVRTVTISTGVIHVVNGGHVSNAFSSDLSFIHIARVGGPPPSSGAARLMLSLLS